jgi:hypothetical protein
MIKKISRLAKNFKTFFFTAQSKFELVLNILIAALSVLVIVLAILLTFRYQVWLKSSLYLDQLFSGYRIEKISTEVDSSLPSPIGSQNELLNLSSEELTDRDQDLQAVAVNTNQIVIKDCQADPEVVLVTKGQSLSFENQNDFVQTLIIGEESIMLPANSSQQAAPTFQYGAGTYGYHCDSQVGVKSPNQNAGLFLVKD